VLYKARLCHRTPTLSDEMEAEFDSTTLFKVRTIILVLVDVPLTGRFFFTSGSRMILSYKIINSIHIGMFNH